MTDAELIEAIERQRALMIAVATGGPRIQDVNQEYVARRSQIRAELERRGLKDPNPYEDLWQWYGKWSSGDLPSWQSRRVYLVDLHKGILEGLRRVEGERAELYEEPTGWARVDRNIGEIRRQLEKAEMEEQFQAVGLHCRETLISLAQQVYDPTRHAQVDGVDPSPTDAKRMLEAYLVAELAGPTNEIARRHARAAIDLANELQHRRTATFRQAALCAEATTAVVNMIAIVSGRRDSEAGGAGGVGWSLKADRNAVRRQRVTLNDLIIEGNRVVEGLQLAPSMGKALEDDAAVDAWRSAVGDYLRKEMPHLEGDFMRGTPSTPRDRMACYLERLVHIQRAL
jgi:hypothetical protein